VKGALGSWIVCDEWKQDPNTYEWSRINVKCVKVDGKKIKADTFYQLKNGKWSVVK
jgi:hypothetical protein